MTTNGAAIALAGTAVGVLIGLQVSHRSTSACVTCTASAKITISLLPVEPGTIIDPTPDACLIVSLLPEPR